MSVFVCRNNLLLPSVKCFDGAAPAMHGTTRFVRRDGKIAVLSATAQKIFKDKNQYMQYNSNKDNVAIDEIGILMPINKVYADKWTESSAEQVAHMLRTQRARHMH